MNITLLAIDWSAVGIKTGQLVLSLSILVVLHELGHFLPAKWFKCRVEKFYLFFDPWFSIFKRKIGDTVYGVGWLPLGGYVKIAGMIDESMDKEQMKQPAQPYEFRAKPAWQRLIIMVGGVTVNLLLGFFIFAMILYTWGEEYLPVKNLKYGVYVDSLGEKIGIKNGDMILGVNGKPLNNFVSLSSDFIFNEAKTIQVRRDGRDMDLSVPEGSIRALIQGKDKPLAWPAFPAVADSVIKSEAKFVKGEFLRGDTIISLNGKPIRSYYEFQNLKKNYPSSEIAMKAIRAGGDTVDVVAKTNEKALISMSLQTPDKFLVFEKKSYSFFEAFPAGVRQGLKTLGKYIQNFKMMFTSDEVKVNDSLGSFLSIGNMFGASWDWERFWTMTALFSIILAFTNILPIPALDGGHILFTLYEMVTGKKPGDKFMEFAQMIGMIFLLLVMAYALGLDFWRFLFKS